MRGTTRDDRRRAAIEATGAECYIGDPDRIGTLTYALESATILCWLLGSAAGEDEPVAALHGTRLKMLLERTIDTTVRGFVYEAAGTVHAPLLAAGAEIARAACAYSEIPYRAVAADPGDPDGWVAAMHAAIGELLSG